MLGQDGYRRRADVQARRAVDERRGLLLDDAHMDIGDLLLETPDPASTFNDETRVMPASYREHTVVHLANEFPQLTRAVIVHILEQHAHVLLPAERQLRALVARESEEPPAVGYAAAPDGRFAGHPAIEQWDWVGEMYAHHGMPPCDWARARQAHRERVYGRHFVDMLDRHPLRRHRARRRRLPGVVFAGAHFTDAPREPIAWPAVIDEQFFRELRYLRNHVAVDVHRALEIVRYADAQSTGPTVTCPICLEETIPEERMFECRAPVDTTHGHAICRACLRQHANTLINERASIDCSIDSRLQRAKWTSWSARSPTASAST